MIILGINFFFEHISVAYIVDGKLMFAAEEERFTGIKGGKRYSPFTVQFPYKSMYAGLKFLDITVSDIDYISLSYNKWDHLFGLFRKRWSLYDDYYALRSLFHIKRIFSSDYEVLQYMSDRIDLRELKRIPILSFDHHMSHAASAYCYSSFDKSLVFVADCCGEESCTSIYIGTRNGLKKIKSYDIPDSLGIMYAVVTKYLGFDSFSDEYKVMGLASYGNDTYRKQFRDIIKYDDKGNYKVDSKKLFSLPELLGPSRASNEPINQRHKDIAKSLQNVLEEGMIAILSYYRKKTGIENLCMAGGIALNCVANGKIAETKLFKEIFVQPAASDAGTSMGSAALAYKKICGEMQILYKNMYLGTSYDNGYIKRILDNSKLSYRYLDDEEMESVIAKKIAEGLIGGIFRGRMENGPRALGNRSVIASPVFDGMVERINNIKEREMFRPIAPIVLEECFEEYFDGMANKYMLFTSFVKENKQDKIPAVTHVDRTSRVQTINIHENPFIYNLIKKFSVITGVPVIINTSLNFKGKPIIENPVEAIGNFYSSGLDFLVLENYLLEKDNDKM